MTESRRGRPRGGQTKDPAERRSSAFTFRMRDHLKQDLEASARLHGRTLSEEVTYRLERSFREGRALENMSQELKYWWREQGATDEQIKEWIGSLSDDSPDALATREQSHGFFARIVAPGNAPASSAAQTLDEEAVYRAVTRALRETLPPTLTNRDKTAEPPEPPTVAPVASPAEQAAWSPVMTATPNPDEPAQDGQPAKGGRKRPPAE